MLLFRWYLVALLLMVHVATIAAGREVIDFDEGWRFRQDGGRGDDGWTAVRTPHDWSIAGPVREDAPTGGAGGFMPSGVGLYRKEFVTPTIPPHGRVSIEFDGVMAHSKVWINDELLGERPNGYVSFAYDLTDHLKGTGEKNLIEVRADTSAQPASRWYTGAGIYRHVRLVVAPPLRVARDGVFVTTPQITAERAEVRVAVETADERPQPSVRARIHAAIIDPAGRRVASSRTRLDPTGETTLKLTLLRPTLWDVDRPAMHRLVTQLVVRGEVVDEVVTPFGVRTAEFSSERGFVLNGESVKLKGVCLHHDGGAVGAAVPLRVWQRRLERLRALGVNAVRTAHNPVAPEFLDLCDRMGFLVMDEFFDCWTRGKNKHDYHRDFEEWWRRDLTDTVRRDRNHPSVLLYSVGNEIRDTHDTELAKRVLTGLVDACHAADPSRPVTQALFRPNVTHDYDNGLADLLDVVGTNYRDAELLQAWRDDPSRKIVGTEQNHDRSTWLRCRDNPQHSGQFLWCGIDYLGESRRWPVNTFDAGLLDRTGLVSPRGMERAGWWAEEPVLYVVRRVGRDAPIPVDPGYEEIEWVRKRVRFDDWNPLDNPMNAEAAQQIEVYSNAEEVELLLNGRSLGAKQIDPSAEPRQWSVAYEPGELVAIARNGVREVARRALRTAGEPAALRLKSDRPGLTADWDDVAHVEVEVVDAAGVLVPDATPQIEFAVEGPGRVIAVDNGSIVSTESYQASTRQALRGRCLAIVRADANEGTIRVTATAEGLESSSVVVRE
ncbi:Beta-galactosidase [Pseudobythopirellula maris]|uniref:Beta-galactosidase n=1 Tax=Pseudobythopirellula maris TaxID=2527991 RepID=A0A5C5ZV10_9BACT|nr:glycoside hydrolase family 2 TIM barrel-domain containing protein [Pseudobythopirellula maris]TWT90868.1 Beta-galactosidase [Pseudobythopirellula maris]